jgi:hypothetical protein
MSVNVISAEQDAAFYKLNVDNIVVEVPKTTPAPGQKGVWVPIKYKYGTKTKEKIDKLKIQTSELFSYGISRYEESSPAKMCLVMVNRKLREDKANGEAIREEEAEDIKVEDATVKMLEDITRKVKEAMKQPEMVKALGKKKLDVDGMEIVKRKEQENGIDSVYVYAKVVTADNFMKTKFLMLDDDEEEGVRSLDQDETIEKLSQKNVNCRATAILVIDSVFVGSAPYLQVRLAEVLLRDFIEYKPKRNIIMPARFKNKSASAELYDSDESNDAPETPAKKVIKDDSDDSDSD